MRHGAIGAGLLALVLAGCGDGGARAPSGAGDSLAAALSTTEPAQPAGTCWHQADLPAVLETVTERALLEGGAGPAVVTSESRQRVVRDRQQVWFRVPCAEDQGARFVASLQRALKARGLYGGAVTAVADAETARAVRRYQAARGLDSDVLSWLAAQQMGLVPGDRD
jgi:hypothetical protein